MEMTRHKMEESNLDNLSKLVENICEPKTEITAQNGGKKPKVPPKPIVPQDNLKYKERTIVNRENHEKIQLELEVHEGESCSCQSARAVPKPPLLPKPSPQVYQNSLVHSTNVKNKLSLSISNSVQPCSYTTANTAVEYNDKNNAANLREADNMLSDAVVARGCYDVTLEDEYHSSYERDCSIKEKCSAQGKTKVDCGSFQATNSLVRCDPFYVKCEDTSIHHIRTSSLPNIYFEDKTLFINNSNKVLLKHYPCVNAVCDTFYPSDLCSLNVKFMDVTLKMSDPCIGTSCIVEDHSKDGLSACNAVICRNSRHNSSILSSNAKTFELQFQDSEDFLECSGKSKSTSSMCILPTNDSKCESSSPSTDSIYFRTKNVSFNLHSNTTQPLARRYSLPPCCKSRLRDKLQLRSLNNSLLSDENKKITKILNSNQSSRSTWCFDCASGHTSSKYKDSKFSYFLEKVKPGREVKSNSTFYFEHDLSEREITSGASNVTLESIYEPEEESHNDNLSIVVDNNRPASGFSGVLEFNENSDAPSSKTCYSVQDISDSDNDEIVSLQQPLTDAERKEKKAFYTVKELVTSEKVFIDVLILLTEDLKNAVKISEKLNNSSIIPEENFSRIFNSLPQLRHLNEDLLHDLENRVNNWEAVKKISDVIVKKGPFLKLYSTYIQNFEFQCSYLDECCYKYPKFARVVKEFEASPRCKKLSLKHYMIKPVQRIPQYRLILSDYLSTQDCDSPDYEDTKAALKIVCDVAEHANRRLKLGDGLKKLMQLQTMLRNYDIIKPGRDLIKDGELFKLSRKVMQPRYFILLNDCLLCTSYIGSTIHSAESVKVNYQLPLDDLKVSVPKTEAYENEFSIISTQRSFRLSARSSEERDEWVRVLKDAIREYEKRKESFKRKPCDVPDEEVSFPAFNLGKDAPVWVHDFRVTRCQSCTELFTVTFRRHHCRACGKVVCGNCSENRAPLEYKKYHSSRVCGECFESLLREFEESAPQLGSSELDTVRARFVKKGETGKKKYVPERLLEVTANDTKSQMSGWLQKRSRRSWKRYWFVLKNQVLYVYKASEDVVALESIPVLGYEVISQKETLSSLYEGVNKNLVFQLHHIGQTPITFHADSEQMASKWIAALVAQTVF